MKTYWCLIITLFVLASQGTVSSQNLYSPYPIIFVHGLNSNDSAWSNLIDSMKKNYGMIFGGRMDFCLNQDGNTATSKIPEDYKDYTNRLYKLTKGDLYTINFDVNNLGIPYNNLVESTQSGIVKQGLAVADAIKHVLTITSKDKVILVGHSMGGLAIREYLQNEALWFEPSFNHHVAKICTIGTPHGGSNATDFGTNASKIFFNLDLSSEAVRDLRTSYFCAGMSGVYLFGGVEDKLYIRDNCLKDFKNVDVNCDGIEAYQTFIGLNNKKIPSNLDLSCIIGTGDPLGANSNPTQKGDGVVSEYSANLNNFYPTANAAVFELKKTSNILSVWHLELTNQIGSIIEALDEPNNISLAYEIKINDRTKGFITYQTNNLAADQDVFKINVLNSGFLTVNIAGYFEAGLDSLELLDSSDNLLSHVEYPFIHNGISKFITAGTYYLRVSGTAKSNSYLNPYTITTKFHESESSIEGIVELEYFVDSDPGFGKGLSKYIPSSNSITENINIPLISVSNGFHSLFIRVKDVKNRWSNTQNIPFYKLKVISSNISKLEYFIDTDPGFGNGTKLSVSATDDISKRVNIPLSNVSNGFHVLYVRAKDNNGNWSIASNSVFYKVDISSADIVKMEYFLDTDPGFDNATSIPIPKNANINKSFNIDLSNVSNGFHTLFIRTKNASGKWSIPSNNAFYRMQSKPSNITELEYFFDMDPGFGYGTSIPISPATSDITKLFNIDLACLSAGNHTFYVRTKNDMGNWSLIYSKNITVTITSPIITQNGNILHSNALIGNQWYNQNGLINGATNQDYVLTSNGNYYVIITRSGCSSVKSNTISIINVGVEQTKMNNSIKIYPNPTEESFCISGFEGVAAMKLIDISGKLILSKQITVNETILINNLSQGVYIVKLITAGGIVERKLVKK